MNEKPHDTIPPQKIVDLGYYFLNVLQAKAWQYLGLMVHPENGETLIDFHEAKQAIDLFQLILNHLQNDLPSSIKKEMEMHLTNLQLNYVEKMKKAKESS